MNQIFVIETQLNNVQLGIYNNLCFTSRINALSYLRMKVGTANLCVHNRIGFKCKRSGAVYYINPLKLNQ